MRPLIFMTAEPSPNYAVALKNAGFRVTTTDHENADGLLLPGGGDICPCLYGKPNFYCKNTDFFLDVKELFYIRKFLNKEKPVMGICRGLQVINVFFGGTLIGHYEGHSGIEDVGQNCRFFGELKTIYGESGIVSCNHHQIIDKLGEGLKITAISDDGVIEGISGKNLTAYQFHPERMSLPQTDGRKIFKLFRQKFR